MSIRFAPNRTQVIRLKALLINQNPLKTQIRKWKVIKFVELTIENYNKCHISN